METASVVVGGLLGIVFIGLGVAKIADAKPMLGVPEHLGLAKPMFRLVGGFEAFGGAGLILGLHKDLSLVGVLAAIGLIGLTIGAASYHQRAGDSMKEWLPAVAMGSVAIFYIILRIATA